MTAHERSRTVRRSLLWRAAWLAARWLWFPIGALAFAGEVHGSGVLVLLSFLGILWAGERGLAVRRAWREVRRWPSLRAAANSFRVRIGWPLVSADLGLVDGSGETPQLVEVAPRPYGADVLLDVTGDNAALRSLEDRRGALARWFGVANVQISQERPGRLRVEVRAVDPLSETRPARPNVAGGGVRVRLGRYEDGSDLVVDLADPWHLAIQGMTRSGKSVLTYSLLSGVARRSDVLVAGVDPTGVLLGPWSGAPSDDLRAIGTADMSAAAGVVERAMGVMESRIAGLGKADKVGPPSAACPLLVVVLEEYPGVLAAATAEDAAQGRKPAERAAARIRRGVQRLILEGAKVGVRVVLLAQRMDAEIVGGAERSNLGTRISLRVDNGEAVRMLHPTATPDVVERMATATPGMAYVDLPGERGRWAKADLMDYSEYRAAVAAHELEEVA